MGVKAGPGGLGNNNNNTNNSIHDNSDITYNNTVRAYGLRMVPVLGTCQLHHPCFTEMGRLCNCIDGVKRVFQGV